MSERPLHSSERDLTHIYPSIKDKSWTHSVIAADDESLTTQQSLDRGNGKTESITAIYRKFSIPELHTAVYVLEDSMSAALPHGSACYLPEWDVILVRAGAYGLIDTSRESLSDNEFTVLAHELGHREDYKQTDKEAYSHLSYAEKEIRAWQHAKRIFGEHEKFDHEYADHDMKSYMPNDKREDLNLGVA